MRLLKTDCSVCAEGWRCTCKSGLRSGSCFSTFVKISDRLGARYVVEMSCAAEDASVYYTITEDGSEPGIPDKSNGALYESPRACYPGCKIKAIAYVGENASNVASFNPEVPFVINEFASLLTLTEEDVASPEFLSRKRGCTRDSGIREWPIHLCDVRG